VLKNVRKGVIDNFQKEIDVVSLVRFPYLVQFLGASTTPPHLFILMEYMQGGNLHDFIRRNKGKLTRETLLKIAKQIAHGVHYLHSCKVCSYSWPSYLNDQSCSHFVCVRTAHLILRNPYYIEILPLPISYLMSISQRR